MKSLEWVKSVLDSHFSGGAKFTEIVSCLTAARYEQGVVLDDLDFKDSDWTEQLLKKIRGSKEVQILRYRWRPINREKLFIFTK